ncbi:conserved protein of unknown function [Candidatus Hydrogenisulfobacillus filiaventi]|uniref:DNA-directed DNA polymerase n=1 Tax=Candidatus Hydrogenisulfobacillus filiaventi TaxID=2707344 RepID=A0A6F8ZKZ3_9FIRM|nr:conserved protein of unknown function [Candidatus Hydrogenisulfobacillus filiaventi]
MRNSDLERWPVWARAWARGGLGRTLLVTGEDTAALTDALAAAWLCEGDGEPGPCRCRSCRTPRSRHPDYRELAAEPRSIGREAVGRVLDGLLARPLWSPYRVVRIRQADTLTPDAGAHLLKVLEEPPPYQVFLLETARPDRLLPTIRSRCRWVRTLPAGGGPEEGVAADWAGLTDPAPGWEERLVVGARAARARYLAGGGPAWLQLWEACVEAEARLAANANRELVAYRLTRLLEELGLTGGRPLP